MNAPSLLSRSDTDELSSAPDRRSATSLEREVRIAFEGGATGEAAVQVFRSKGTEDRGGTVLRITLIDQGSSFIPYAQQTPAGVEIHLAGDIESKSVLAALRLALLP